MKPTASRISAACLLLLLACAFTQTARGQSRQPSARKFDELTYPLWPTGDEAEKAMRTRIRLYVAQLRSEGARPYAIAYGPRVVDYSYSDSSVANKNAGALWPYLTGAGFDGQQINWVNGGFREYATTELWVVPPGATPPCPTPTVRPEDVAYCPRVSVRGGTYVPRPSGPLSFRADLSVNVRKVSPTFSWSVSQGRVVEGQGTEKIAVELPEGARGEVVARVEVHGFSLECPVEGTAAYAKTTVGVTHFKLDEFGDIRSGDTKARLDNLAVTMQEDPTMQAYFVVYGGRTGPRGQAARRAASLKDYITNTRGIDPARIFTVEGGFRDELSAELWLSPQGAPAPPARPTVDEDYVRPKGDVRRRP